MPRSVFSKRYLALFVLLAWMLLIFFMSSQVATTSSGLSGVFVEPIKPYAPGFTEGILTTLVRKSAHVFLYFILGVLSINVFRDYIHDKKKLIVASTAFVFLYAVSDEIHQMFVPGRSGQMGDVLIDSIAGLLGIMVCYYFLKRDRKES